MIGEHGIEAFNPLAHAAILSVVKSTNLGFGHSAGARLLEGSHGGLTKLGFTGSSKIEVVKVHCRAHGLKQLTVQQVKALVEALPVDAAAECRGIVASEVLLHKYEQEHPNKLVGPTAQSVLDDLNRHITQVSVVDGGPDSPTAADLAAVTSDVATIIRKSVELLVAAKTDKSREIAFYFERTPTHRTIKLKINIDSKGLYFTPFGHRVKGWPPMKTKFARLPVDHAFQKFIEASGANNGASQQRIHLNYTGQLSAGPVDAETLPVHQDLAVTGKHGKHDSYDGLNKSNPTTLTLGEIPLSETGGLCVSNGTGEKGTRIWPGNPTDKVPNRKIGTVTAFSSMVAGKALASAPDGGGGSVPNPFHHGVAHGGSGGPLLVVLQYDESPSTAASMVREAARVFTGQHQPSAKRHKSG